jgi:hypothetical protein
MNIVWKRTICAVLALLISLGSVCVPAYADAASDEAAEEFAVRDGIGAGVAVIVGCGVQRVCDSLIPGMEKSTGAAAAVFEELTLDIGAEEPFVFIHASDTHICRAGPGDEYRMMKMSASRRRIFPYCMQVLEDVAKKAEELQCFVVHTGDMIDFVSEENLAQAQRFTDRVDCIMAAGNHEFTKTLSEKDETPENKNAYLEQVQRSFRNDIRFYARQVNGVNLVALDNSYYQIEPWQLEKLKEEVERGLPVILFLHVPLYTPEEYDYAVAAFGLPAWLMNVPEKKMEGYGEDAILHQGADESTKEAYDYIVSAPNVMAIFCGHLHYNHLSMVTPQLPQYVTDCTTGRIVTVR